MANVLYVDANAFKGLAVAGLLNTLLDTGRQVIVTTSVRDELSSSPGRASDLEAISWINRNIVLGNVREARRMGGA